MKRTIIFTLLITIGIYTEAQDYSGFGIKISGFVKNDFFIDSRQTICAREGHFLLWPAPENLDAKGDDINAKPTFNMLSIQSRLSGKISGPDALGAKTSGLIEGDFFAQANDNINLLRMRHAYVKLNWRRSELLTGYTWNPLFITGCFPGTVSFNTGAPIQSFARNPQIRFTYNPGKLKIIAAALSQVDYTSRGVDGPDCKYLRNSATPDMHLQLHYATENPENGNGIIAGGGLAYKTIVPRLKNDISEEESYRVDEVVGGLTLLGFTKVTTGSLTLKAQVRYGENISDVLAISGFAVRDTVDPITGEQSYTPLKSIAYWGEVHTNGNPQVGVFAGIINNMGSKEALINRGNEVYGLATNIRSMFRISPRIFYNAGKVRLAFELEYTRAEYGKNYDEHYLPELTVPVGNFRGLLAVYYFF